MVETASQPFEALRAQKITDFLRVEHGAAIPRTEVGLILGNIAASPAVAAKAAELYQAGAFERIIVSGGVKVAQTHAAIEISAIWNREHGLPLPVADEKEAHYLRRTLVGRFGIPERMIAVEDESLNTGENVRYAKDRYSLNRAESLTLVNITPGNRRGLATARQFLGEEPVIVTQGAFQVPGVTWANWARHDNAPPAVTRHIHGVVEDEFHKIYAEPHAIPPYVMRGLCASIDLGKELERVQGLLTCPAEADRRHLTPRLQRRGISVA